MIKALLEKSFEERVGKEADGCIHGCENKIKHLGTAHEGKLWFWVYSVFIK